MRPNPTPPSSPHLMTHSEMVAIWRTITISPKEIDRFAELVKQNVTPAVNTPRSTEFVHIDQAAENSNKSFVLLSMSELSQQKNSESAFIFIDPNESQKPQPLEISALAWLSENLTISFPALPDFQSAFHLISKKPEESDEIFYLRKLSALSGPFLETNDLTEDKKAIGKALCEWHSTINASTSHFDRVLADTAYFYNKEYHKLIIRHAPIDVTMMLNKNDLTKIIKEVSQCILQQLFNNIPQSLPTIEHLVPMIKEGRLAEFASAITAVTRGYLSLDALRWVENSRHIILLGITEDQLAGFDATPIDPRQTFFESPNYTSLGAQAFFDDKNCGRFLSLIAPIAARVLANHPEKTASGLTPDEFKPYRKFILAAKDRESSALKNLLLGLEEKTSEDLRTTAVSNDFLKPVVTEFTQVSFFQQPEKLKLTQVCTAPTCRVNAS